MTDILDTFKHNFIISVLETLKEDCINTKCRNCRYRDENYACLFMKAPSKFDIYKIYKALQTNTET